MPYIKQNGVKSQSGAPETQRRDLLKAAMTAPPALPLMYSARNAPPRHPAWRDKDFFDRYAAWVRAEFEMARLHALLKDAEADAKRRGVDWRACRVVREINEKLSEVYDHYDGTLETVMLAPATSLNGIAVKLAMWRRNEAREDHIMFAFPSMGLPFSAYRDLVAMTGRRDLAHPKDEAVMRAMRRIDAERRE